MAPTELYAQGLETKAQLCRRVFAPSAIWFGIVFGEADPPLIAIGTSYADKVSMEPAAGAVRRRVAFANQNAPINVLPFEGSV